MTRTKNTLRDTAMLKLLLLTLGFLLMAVAIGCGSSSEDGPAAPTGSLCATGGCPHCRTRRPDGSQHPLHSLRNSQQPRPAADAPTAAPAMPMQAPAPAPAPTMAPAAMMDSSSAGCSCSRTGSVPDGCSRSHSRTNAGVRLPKPSPPRPLPRHPVVETRLPRCIQEGHLLIADGLVSTNPNHRARPHSKTTDAQDSSGPRTTPSPRSAWIPTVPRTTSR